MDAEQVLQHHQHFAVIGITSDHEKYGYKIYQCLKRHHYQVYPVSPRYNDIEGDVVYPNLKEVNHKIEVAVFVVSPKYGYEYVQQCLDLGIEYLWLQPGTYDDEFLAHLDELPVHYYLDCVLRRLEP
ncbi:MAG: CoA-binding protein [Longicatena sp.]